MSSKQRFAEAHNEKRKHGLIHFLARTAILVAAIYVVYSIISNNIAIRDNMQRYNELAAETAALQARNEQINGYLNDKNLDDYIQDIARDKLDYANADERVYYVVPAAN